MWPAGGLAPVRITRPHRLQAFYLGRNPEAGDGEPDPHDQLGRSVLVDRACHPVTYAQAMKANDPWSTVSDWEPPIGSEPMTYALRAAHLLALIA